MAWNKVVFDHTLITSEFLNELQDYIMSLSATPQLCLYEEVQGDIIPSSGTVTLSAHGLLNDREPVVGDILLGTQTQAYGIVTATDGQLMTVNGLGHL